MEPRSTDSYLIRTPAYNGQFRLPRQKSSYIFSQINPLYADTGYTDKGHFSVSREKTIMYCQPRFTDTGYLQTVYKIIKWLY